MTSGWGLTFSKQDISEAVWVLSKLSTKMCYGSKCLTTEHEMACNKHGVYIALEGVYV